MNAQDVLFYVFLAGLGVGVASRLRPSWFVQSRSRRTAALALLYFACAWTITTTATATVGAALYGWGDPAIIWPSILIIGLLSVWLVRQARRLHSTAQAAPRGASR